MSNGTDRPARAALPKPALGSPQERPKASRASPFPFPIDPTPLTPQRSAERRFWGLSTDCCDSGELSTLKHPYSFPVKHPYSALKSPVKHPYTQVVKDQVVQEQVVGATTTVNKSPDQKPKNQTPEIALRKGSLSGPSARPETHLFPRISDPPQIGPEQSRARSGEANP